MKRFILYSLLSMFLVWVGCSFESSEEAVRNCVDQASLCKYARQQAESMRGDTKADHCYPKEIGLEPQGAGRYSFTRTFLVTTRGTWMGINTYRYTVYVSGTARRTSKGWQIDYGSISAQGSEGDPYSGGDE